MNNHRNYLLLLAGQFLSAFGDNVILVVILGPLMAQLRAGTISSTQQSLANIVFTSLLFVPYVLFAPIAGYLNDRFAKSRWLVGGNLLKLTGAAIAATALIFQASAGTWRAAGYFVVGIGACLYSPAKYGVLPEILPAERLVKANGTVELLTLIAILTGNIGGSRAVDLLPQTVCYLLVVAIYTASLMLNLLMSRTPSFPEVQWQNSVPEFFQNVRLLFSQKRLGRILIGTAVFWVCGALIQMNFQPWGQQVLHLQTMTQISLLGLWLSIGVMIGSVLAGQLYRVGDLRATRRYGWLLAAALTVLSAIGWIGSAAFLPQIVLVLAGLVAGLYLIPLNAALQAECHKDKLGKTIATQNAFENLAMLAGGLIAFADVKIGFNPSQLFLALAGFVAIVVTWLKIPDKS